MPALQLLQEADAIPVHDPAVQRLQVVRAVAPTTEDQVPALQAMQIALDAVAKELDQVPALQLAQTVSTETVATETMYCPTLHVKAGHNEKDGQLDAIAHCCPYQAEDTVDGSNCRKAALLHILTLPETFLNWGNEMKARAALSTITISPPMEVSIGKESVANIKFF